MITYIIFFGVDQLCMTPSRINKGSDYAASLHEVTKSICIYIGHRLSHAGLHAITWNDVNFNRVPKQQTSAEF